MNKIADELLPIKQTKTEGVPSVRQQDARLSVSSTLTSEYDAQAHETETQINICVETALCMPGRYY